MKLGVIIPRKSANANYRAIFPLQALEERGHNVVWPADVPPKVAMSRLGSCDVVHCFRSWERMADLEAISRRGIAVSFDNDDNLRASDIIGGSSGLKEHRENREFWAIYERMARLADVVTTPSEVLAEKYRGAGARDVAVIENHLDSRMACFGHRSRHEGLVVGWVAAAEHAKDVVALGLVEILSRLLDAHENLRVLTVGVRLPLGSPRYEYIQDVAHYDLLKVVSRIDVGIAPLLDTEFNRSRSNVKLKEYGAGGAAWVASPVGPYRNLGAQQGGVLVERDGWFEALDRLLSSRIARARLARRALRWARTQTIDRHAEEWERRFESAVESAAVRARERVAEPRRRAIESRRKTRR